MKPEGQVRIPSGCAIAAVISKAGNQMPGNKIMEAIRFSGNNIEYIEVEE